MLAMASLVFCIWIEEGQGMFFVVLMFAKDKPLFTNPAIGK